MKHKNVSFSCFHQPCFCLFEPVLKALLAHEIEEYKSYPACGEQNDYSEKLFPQRDVECKNPDARLYCEQCSYNPNYKSCHVSSSFFPFFV